MSARMYRCVAHVCDDVRVFVYEYLYVSFPALLPSQPLVASFVVRLCEAAYGSGAAAVVRGERPGHYLKLRLPSGDMCQGAREDTISHHM